MQQRATVSSQPVEQTADEAAGVQLSSQPVELTEAQLLQVGGGLMGPNGNWATAAAAGPNGNW